MNSDKTISASPIVLDDAALLGVSQVLSVSASADASDLGKVLSKVGGEPLIPGPIPSPRRLGQLFSKIGTEPPPVPRS